MQSSKKSSFKKPGLNCKRLQKFDFLGKNVNLTYQREEVFTTSIGLIVSLISLAFLGIVAYTRTVKLLTREDPSF